MTRTGRVRRTGGRAAVAAVAVRAVANRPRLWPESARTLRRLAPRGWWQRPPFLPVPTAEYVAFRLLTQYGDERARPTANDVVSYLEWSRRQ